MDETTAEERAVILAAAEMFIADHPSTGLYDDAADFLKALDDCRRLVLDVERLRGEAKKLEDEILDCPAENYHKRDVVK